MFIIKKILYFFIIISVVYIISSNNPVYSVFALVFTFINASIYFLILGFEFLGLLYITVYVGAILILFLFVILSFDLSYIVAKKQEFAFNNINIFLLTIWFYYTLLELQDLFFLDVYTTINSVNYFYIVDSKLEDMRIFGNFLYNNLYLYTLLISLILLVVMIGVIIINLENSPYKLQESYKTRKLCNVLIYKVRE